MTKAEARQVRESYLRAFDIYKSNIQYGIEAETPEEHTEVVAWYERLLDLPTDEQVYRNCPIKVKKYLARIL